MRQSVLSALAEITNNLKLGKDYSLEQELADAIALAYNARKHGYKAGDMVSPYARQGNLFQLDDGATAGDFNNATMLMLADVLNDNRVTRLKNVIRAYNTKAADAAIGQMDVWSGGVKSKKDIINEVNNIINNGKEEGNTQKQKGSVQQDGAAGTSSEGKPEVKPEETKPSGETLGTEPVEEVKPVGTSAFGNIYNQFKGKVKEAFEWLFSHKDGDILGVFHRDEIGDIDLVWGKVTDAAKHKGYGLAHIWDKHREEFGSEQELATAIEDIINNGEFIEEGKHPNTSEFHKDGKKVVVKRVWGDGDADTNVDKNWVVTAFELSEKESSGTTPPSSAASAGESRPATFNGKGSDNSSSDQEKKEKSEAEEKENVSKWLTEYGKKYGHKIEAKWDEFDIDNLFGKIYVDGKDLGIYLGIYVPNNLAESIPYFLVETGFEPNQFDEATKLAEQFNSKIGHEAAEVDENASYIEFWNRYDGANSLENAMEYQAMKAANNNNAEQQRTEPGTHSKGSGNKLVTDERYEQLLARMKAKLGQLNVGVDPEMLAIGTEMAVYHIEKGARKFTQFAKAMIEDLGDAIRPYLKSFYNGARDLPEVEENGWTDEMTPYDEVRVIDVANFDKNVINSMDTAETVVREQQIAQQAEEAKEQIIETRNNNRKEVEQKSAEKKSKSKKKDVSLQQEQQLDLFGDLNGQASETSNSNSNETTDVQSRTAEEGRGGHEPQQDAQVGRSAGHEAEGTDGRGMGRSNTTNTRPDGERSLGVSGTPQSQQHVEAATETDGKASGTVTAMECLCSASTRRAFMLTSLTRHALTTCVAKALRR